MLHVAGGLEQRSEHPIAEAIVDRSREHDVALPDVSEFESITGKGVTACIDGIRYFAGNPAMLEEFGQDLDTSSLVSDGGTAEMPAPRGSKRLTDVIVSLEEEGKSVVIIGCEEELVGIIAIGDEIRPGSKRAIEHLHRLGVAPLVMLTGDNDGTAREVAEELGLDEYYAELLPQEKVETIEMLESEYGSVAMVGDGINDAPALASASVGVAMGAAGTDTAIETADIALMGDDIGNVPYVYKLAHKANGVIRQNIWSSLGVKFLLAIGVPFGYVSVAAAVVIGDMGMSLGVTGNAMRLSRLRADRIFE